MEFGKKTEPISPKVMKRAIEAWETMTPRDRVLFGRVTMDVDAEGLQITTSQIEKADPLRIIREVPKR